MKKYTIFLVGILLCESLSLLGIQASNIPLRIRRPKEKDYVISHDIFEEWKVEQARKQEERAAYLRLFVSCLPSLLRS